ncbi:antitoxin [Phycicoccus sp. CSK15P-2]|uniref:antitoxin n=1 Tax=Phycicoccus sp. CSK15P-2 TaxID=2807627 RepID=UPI001950C750|nr:antitoxin [Phycicoccus sp. CSK15P-2]MBM6405022.1 antitoxin [Phycicoccus sp. CSK15P-2]
MGFLDSAKEKLTELADKHPDQAEKFSDQVIERGGDAVDSATGGKYADHVDRAQAKADDAIGEPERDAARNQGRDI